jgi:hypothetical protein
MFVNPLIEVQTAEADVVRSLDAATAQLTRVGTTEVDAAMASYQRAAFEAKVRIDAAYRQLHGAATDLVFHLRSVAGAIDQTITRPLEAVAPKVESKSFEQAFGLTEAEATAAQKADADPVADARTRQADRVTASMMKAEEEQHTAAIATIDRMHAEADEAELASLANGFTAGHHEEADQRAARKTGNGTNRKPKRPTK